MRILEGIKKEIEGIVSVGLLEFHFSKGIRVDTDQMRYLLEYQKQADGGQHTTYHRGWKIMRDEARLGDTKGQLHGTRQNNGCEKYIEAQFGDGPEDDHIQARRRATDREMRSTEKPDDNTADHSCDQPRNKRRSARQSNAHAEGQCNEKYNDTCGQVFLPIF